MHELIALKRVLRHQYSGFHNHMNLSALKEQLVPVILKFQEFRDSLPDEEWDALMDDWNTELLIDSLTEVEDVLIKDDLVE